MRTSFSPFNASLFEIMIIGFRFHPGYMWIDGFWQEGVTTHLIYQSADVLFVLPEDEQALLAIVGAHGQGEHVKAGLGTLEL